MSVYVSPLPMAVSVLLFILHLLPDTASDNDDDDDDAVTHTCSEP